MWPWARTWLSPPWFPARAAPVLWTNTRPTPQGLAHRKHWINDCDCNYHYYFPVQIYYCWEFLLLNMWAMFERLTFWKKSGKFSAVNHLHLFQKPHPITGDYHKVAPNQRSHSPNTKSPFWKLFFKKCHENNWLFVSFHKEIWHYEIHTSSSFFIFFSMSLLKVDTISIEEYISRHSPKGNLTMLLFIQSYHFAILILLSEVILFSHLFKLVYYLTFL